MIIVIIAGGSGTRLWPLSTHDYPKHLLALTNDRSLLQNAYDRVKNLSDQIFVITEKSHSKYVRQQLPELKGSNIISEPARRGTASCLLLALNEIKRRHLPDQAIFFLWGDHVVKDVKAFGETVKQVTELAEFEKKLVFVGSKPTYPTTGLGYIFMGKKYKSKFKNVHELRQFVEKPDAKTAKLYFNDGRYLWNSGYLAGTAKVFEREMKQHAPRLWNGYRELNSAILPTTRKRYYMHFVSEPIDTALSEHVPDALVAEAPFEWIDVGSFSDLHGAIAQDKQGNTVTGQQIETEGVKNSLIRNDSAVPVAVIGLDNVAVIVSESGILVTNKEQAQRVGDISKKLQARNKKGFKWLEKL